MVCGDEMREGRRTANGVQSSYVARTQACVAEKPADLSHREIRYQLVEKPFIVAERQAHIENVDHDADDHYLPREGRSSRV